MGEKSSKASCNSCGKLILKSSLNKHMKEVHNPEFKTCPQCNKDINKFKFNYHLRAHNGNERAHKCNFCEYKANFKENLNMHIRYNHQRYRRLVTTKDRVRVMYFVSL